MKELSIEEKAKAYDEVVNKLKGFMAQGVDPLITRADAQDFFPELKESEDERIRKDIVFYIAAHHKDDGEKARWLYWLEKQGKPVKINPTEFDLRLNKLLKQFETLPKEELVNCLSFYLNVVQNDGTYKSDEKQGEQKPADKVEPKFYEGDWVVENEPNNYARFIQILEVVDIQGKERYRISRDLHNDEDVVECRFIENNYHLFNIKDAKDGDVLVSSSGKPFIFKGFFDNDPMAYGGLVADDSFWPASNSNWTTVYYKPATKEQRDLLFQKMKESGYEWDSEKKELKKIEQKLAMMSLDEAIEHCKEKSCGNSACALEHKQLEKWLIELKELKEQNTVWNEEDEKYWSIVIAEFSKCAGKSVSKDEWMRCNDWLNSLRDRVQSQSKKEWSEEDEYIRLRLIDYLYGKSRLAKDREDGINWLKSLRPQNRWIPSEEQIKVLQELCKYSEVANLTEKGVEILKSMYNDIKKLVG